jgi:hypothetical protein
MEARVSGECLRLEGCTIMCLWHRHYLMCLAAGAFMSFLTKACNSDSDSKTCVQTMWGLGSRARNFYCTDLVEGAPGGYA